MSQADTNIVVDTEIKSDKNIGRLFAKFSIALVSVVLCLVVALFSVSAVICLGPSSEFKSEFVKKVSESNATKFLAEVYLSDEEINQIVNF